MSLTLLLVSLVLSSAQGQFSCGEGDLLPDVRDCTRFLKCHAGVPTSLACPAGLRSVLLKMLTLLTIIYSGGSTPRSLPVTGRMPWTVEVRERPTLLSPEPGWFGRGNPVLPGLPVPPLRTFWSSNLVWTNSYHFHTKKPGLTVKSKKV